MEKVFGRQVQRRVVGAGYVGLVTGACLAHVGQRVVCVDRDEGRVAELREGCPVEYTVKEVAELILELSNSASELIYEPLSQDDPKQRCPDTTRAREVLGWEPRVAAARGLSRTIRWFAERRARGEAARDTGRAAG